LAKWKADAAKATLPPLAEKSSKLLKINENLARRKTEATKVAADEREKKNVHGSSPAADLEKRVVSKKRLVSSSEKEKHVAVKEKVPMTMSPSGKRCGPIRSRRQMKTLIYCRRLRFSLAHLILRRGLCGRRLRNCHQRLWPIRRNWMHATPGANVWLK
jgi:hypothetical protein